MCIIVLWLDYHNYCLDWSSISVFNFKVLNICIAYALPWFSSHSFIILEHFPIYKQNCSHDQTSETKTRSFKTKTRSDPRGLNRVVGIGLGLKWSGLVSEVWSSWQHLCLYIKCYLAVFSYTFLFSYNIVFAFKYKKLWHFCFLF